jgi:hypothetical protein
VSINKRTHDRGIIISPVIYSSEETITPETSVLFLIIQNSVQAIAEAIKSQTEYNIESLPVFKEI